MATLLLLLAGCAHAPARLDPPALRDSVPLAGLELPARDGWPQSQWWRVYHDKQLDALIAQAMAQAPDLALAQARVRSAEQAARMAAAQAGLSIAGQAQVARQRITDHGLIPSQFLGFSWYNQADLGAQLQYEFDWWGKKRASIESALDQAHAAAALRSAAALSIQYAVADTYFAWQADTARARLAQQAVTAQEQLMHIAQLRVAQGVDLPDSAPLARAQAAATREMLVALEGSAQIRRAALASLLGIAPGELPPLQPRPLPQVAAGLPANAGLDLLARRPDIAANLWQVQAALKQTDVARAQFYPDISISAMAGLSSIELDKLLTSGSRVFALTPALHLPIFSGGRLQANYGIARAQLDGAVAQYNTTVVNAAREVATQALSAQQTAARTRQQDVQLQAGARLLANAQARQRQGVRDAREALGAQAQLLQQRDAALQLQAQAVATDLNLIKALGGGYQLPATTPNVRPLADAAAPSATGSTTHEQH
ncbi:MAG TPA: efflux transporter outer membrane subunit [Rhodanobacter sp.]|nr:efflux transporter outer membrane subunit [Rhodanobacter sp.]